MKEGFFYRFKELYKPNLIVSNLQMQVQNHYNSQYSQLLLILFIESLLCYGGIFSCFWGRNKAKQNPEAAQ